MARGELPDQVPRDRMSLRDCRGGQHGALITARQRGQQAARQMAGSHSCGARGVMGSLGRGRVGPRRLTQPPQLLRLLLKPKALLKCLPAPGGSGARGAGQPARCGAATPARSINASPHEPTPTGQRVPAHSALPPPATCGQQHALDRRRRQPPTPPRCCHCDTCSPRAAGKESTRRSDARPVVPLSARCRPHGVTRMQ